MKEILINLPLNKLNEVFPQVFSNSLVIFSTVITMKNISQRLFLNTGQICYLERALVPMTSDFCTEQRNILVIQFHADGGKSSTAYNL
jgi:hypothetical protein